MFFLDPGRMGLYFHFYTTLVVSGNILLWLTGTTVVIFNGLFYFSLVFMYISDRKQKRTSTRFCKRTHLSFYWNFWKPSD
nr:Uncharacterized protein A9P81_2446 [Leptospira interrogans serovar Copenhageni/Icterohaemorrhagiae]